MITFYIDDSGSKEINDNAQPIFLFSGVCIPNNLFIEANNFIKDRVEETGKLIMDKLVNKSSKEVKNSDVKYLLKQYLFREFELHATELIHGKKEYICLSKDEKIKLIKHIFEFIRDKNIKVILIKCEKKNIQKMEKSTKEKQEYLNSQVMKLLADSYEEYLEQNSETGVLVFDKGNDLIENYFRDYVKSRDNKRISPYIAQSSSYKTPLIQMADFTAYVINIYFNQKSNYYDDLKEYYEMINKNIIIKDVL